jgi:hypothetical protein
VTCSGFYGRLDPSVLAPLLRGLPDAYGRDFLADRCLNCDRVRLLPMPFCPHCGREGSYGVAIDPLARIYSWTSTHHDFHGGWATVLPYTIVTVDNAQGIRLHVPMCTDGTTDDLVDARTVTLHREHVGGGVHLPVAHPLADRR